MRYHWQRDGWPNFHWNSAELQEIVTRFALRMERVKAVLAAFDPATEEGQRLEAMVAEAVSTSAIEGEQLNPARWTTKRFAMKRHPPKGSPMKCSSLCTG
jgi:Fic family protein